MHELAIASAVLDTAVRHADGRPITRVELRVGALRQVVPGSLDFYFEIVSRDSLADGAELRQELIPALLRCGCGTEWDPAPQPAEEEADVLLPPSFRCPGCGQGGAEVVRGEELEVDSIDVLDTDEAMDSRADPVQNGSGAGAARSRDEG